MQGQDVRQIRVLADAEGGSISILPNGGAQWPYKVRCASCLHLRSLGVWTSFGGARLGLQGLIQERNEEFSEIDD